MSYTPTEWKNGDIITAAKMNNIEQGIVDAAGGSFTETDPTVPGWAKQPTKPSYNFSEINNTPTTLEGYGITNAISYDIIIASTRPITSSYAQDVSQWSIIKGNISDLETKLEANQPITGLAIFWAEAWSQDPPNDVRFYLPLAYMHGPYHQLFFSQTVNFSGASAGGTAPRLISVNFDYNESTKQLSRVDCQQISF